MALQPGYPFVGLGYVAVTTAGTFVPIAATKQHFKAFWAGAFKAKGTANSGNNMYILDSNGTPLWTIPKGVTLYISKLPEIVSTFDMLNLYLDADTSGDALLITGLV